MGDRMQGPAAPYRGIGRNRTGRALLVGSGTAVIASVLLAGWRGLAVLVLAGSVGLAVGMVGRRLLGGMTGDLYGAVNEVAEAAVLVGAVALSVAAPGLCGRRCPDWSGRSCGACPDAATTSGDGVVRMSRWYLVRHGQTDWNLQERFQGQADPPLNDVGREQARAVAARLAGVSFAAAYASDLSRVTETAAAIMRGREQQVTELAELREKHFGAWEGITLREAEARDPVRYRRIFRAGTYDGAAAPPGGESDVRMLQRLAGVADRLRAAHGGGDRNILIVGHGGSLCALVAALLGLPAAAIWRLRLANGGLSQVTVFDDGAATLDLFNDTGHLRSCPAR